MMGQGGFAGCRQYIKGFGAVHESINSRAVGLKFCHDHLIAHKKISQLEHC